MILANPRLVERALTDDAAFADLYEACFPAVFQYIEFRCGDRTITPDLTAQVFEKVLRRLASYRPDKAPFEAWLFAIARNTVTDWKRSQRFRQVLPWDFLAKLRAPDPPPEEAALLTEERRCLKAALAQLDERERDLLGLRFSSGLKNCEIARLVGMNENHVAVLIFRALRKLRDLLGGEVEEFYGR
jgi:RNA polymerase sigma-70 factor (ECF subfamily)